MFRMCEFSLLAFEVLPNSLVSGKREWGEKALMFKGRQPRDGWDFEVQR
jgi:hypothetical protein